MPWSQSPFLRMLFPFATGIALSEMLEANLGLGILTTSVAALFSLTFFLSRRKYKFGARWVFGAAVQAFWVVFGFALAKQHSELRAGDHFSNKISGQDILLATVNDAPAKGNKIRLVLKTQAIGKSQDSLSGCSGNLQIYLEPSPENEQFKYGDRLLLTAKIQPIGPPKNPYGFDYRHYLHLQNIHYQAFVKTEAVQLLERDVGSPLWGMVFQSRERFFEILKKHFKTQDGYAVAAALALGHKADLSDEIRQAYAETGSMHALAVSGSHVAFIFGGIIFLMHRVRMPVRWARWLEPGVALALIWLFTLLTGASASVVRAAFMFSIFLVGKAFWQHTTRWNIMAASAFIQLIINPLWLFDAGFQLSYAAVAGMVFFYPLMLKFAPFPKQKWARWFQECLFVGIAAQLGTLPLGLFYFHQFPVYFWLAGWLVLFVGAAFLYGAFVLVLLEMLAPTVAAWLGAGLSAMVEAMNFLIFGIQKLPFSLIEGVWVTALVCAVLYLALLFFAAAIQTRKGKWLLACLGLLFFVGIGRAVHVFPQFGQRKLTVYNVSRHTLIDFFDGKNLVSLRDSLPEKNVRFASQPLRAAFGSVENSVLNLNSGEGFSSGNLLWQPPFVQFFDKRIVVLDSEKWVENSGAPMAVDFVLLRGNPKLSIAETVGKFRGGLLVFDASNARGRVKKWRAECEILGLKFHDINEDGAFSHDLNPQGLSAF